MKYRIGNKPHIGSGTQHYEESGIHYSEPWSGTEPQGLNRSIEVMDQVTATDRPSLSSQMDLGLENLAVQVTDI